MLSICIPVYNTSIKSLIDSLYKQCIKCAIPFEIICIDDASTLFKEENNSITSYKEVSYSKLNQNVGRSVVRNLLAEKATYNTLLFLDSDVSIAENNFIQKYIDCVKKSIPVVVGGVSYSENFSDATKKLHYTYGTKRESKLFSIRSKNMYSSFLTGNLLIQKKLVQEIQFLSLLKEYGHEDTLFCLELKKRSIPILHIDNPIVHEGLETNEVFVSKQLMAVKNLSFLIQHGYNMKGVSLFDSYLILKKYRLNNLYYYSFNLINHFCENALKKGWTNWLVAFDALRLYKLLAFLKTKKQF